MSVAPDGPYTPVVLDGGRWRDGSIVRAQENDRLAFERTGNPCYVFEAIRAAPPHEPLPTWMRAYLAETAGQLHRMVFPSRRDPSLAPEAATDALPAVFGFRRFRWNAIEERRADNLANGVLIDCILPAADASLPDNRKRRLASNAARLEVSDRTARRLFDRARALWSR